jgi:hypothetical protein
VRRLHPRIWKVPSLTVNALVANRLSSDGFRYNGTTAHEVNGTTVAVDHYTVEGGETSVFHLELTDASYVVLVDLPIEGDLDLAMTFLAVGIGLGIPVDASIKVAETVNMIL